MMVNVRSIRNNINQMNKTIEYRLRTTLSDRKSLLKLLDKGKNGFDNLKLTSNKGF
jgi:hypothetical protein